MRNVVIGLLVAILLIGGVWYLISRPMHPGLTEGEEVVECPVMGTKINPSRAYAKTEYKGKTYYFCCAMCPDKFEKDPEKYLK